MIAAIETFYRGYRFRSRLEARWAVFFDAMGITWEYEKEGYVLPNGECYLPDFWLPQVSMFAEVKPAAFTEDEMRRCAMLTIGTGKPCLMLDGFPDFVNYWGYEPGYGDGEVELQDYDLNEGHRYWETERRFYAGTGASFPERERIEEGIHEGVLAARSARFEHGQRGAAIESVSGCYKGL